MSEQTTVPEKFQNLVEKIEKLSVLELSELVKVLEEKFGVSAAAPMMMGTMPAGGGSDAPAEEVEKSAFDVVLQESGQSKIQVIKAVKEVLGLGLKESKDLVDKAPGVVLKAGMDKAGAEEFKTKLQEAGATVELK